MEPPDRWSALCLRLGLGFGLVLGFGFGSEAHLGSVALVKCADEVVEKECLVAGEEGHRDLVGYS